MKLFLLAGFLCAAINADAQYKNDNVKYRTIFLEDFCEALEANKDYILLDVRSKGEYADTSSSNYLNIGHLKGAINIPVDDLPGRLSEIKKYSNKPLVVYCSHSQRSRKASAMLADSGFSNVMNLNGGLTFFNQFRENMLPCADSLYQTGNRYKFITAPALLARLAGINDIFLLDIRDDSVFRGISTNEALNANGKIKGAVNIPLAKLPSRLRDVPAGKTIVVIDEAGNESPKAARILLEKGFKNVLIAFNGMNMWNATPLDEMKTKLDYWTSPYSFTLVTADDFNTLARSTGSTIVDLRTEDEFNNKAKDSWRNRGNIKGARSIPFKSFADRFQELSDHKDNPVFLYHFSGSPEVFKAAKMLTDDGYSKVYVLVGGIWNIAWRAANIKDKKDLDSWLENVPAENL
jgi:rhodanese-related sulfurtransferase